MKKLFLTLIVFMAMTLTVAAETKEITYYVPNITGVAISTANGVNLRKSPSATSPQLVADFIDEGGDSMPYTLWSNEAKASGAERNPVQLHEGVAVPIISTSDGWSQIIVNGFSPWVKDNFIRKNQLGDLNSSTGLGVTIRKSGVFKDYCLQYYNDEMGGTGILIGKKIGDIVVLPLMVWCYPSFNADINGLNVTKKDGYCSVEYGKDLSDGYYNELDLSRLTDSQFEQLLSVATRNEDIIYVVYAYDGTNQIAEINTSKYTSPLNAVTVAIPQNEHTSSTPNTSEQIFTTVEKSPEFPGGPGAMMKWIGQNMKYPANAAYKNIMGRVLVQFVVMADGSINNVKIKKSVDPELDAEAVRLVRTMPGWNPGTVNGTPVNAYYTLPVTFKIH